MDETLQAAVRLIAALMLAEQRTTVTIAGAHLAAADIATINVTRDTENDTLIIDVYPEPL